MTGLLSEKVKDNELKALVHINSKQMISAEKLLTENLNNKTSSILTYNLLIRLYHSRGDTSSLLKCLEAGIKNTAYSDFYRKFKKNLTVFKICSDIFFYDV